MNTLGSDLLDYAELFSADTITELVSIGRRGRAEKQKEIEAQRAHEKEIEDKKLQAAAAEKAEDRRFEASENDKDRKARIMQEEIQAQGRAADKDANQASFDNISKQTDMALKEMKINNEIELSNKKFEAQQNNDNIKLDSINKDLEIKLKELDHKDRKLSNDRYIAEINKN
jgi:hypothetical protein